MEEVKHMDIIRAKEIIGLLADGVDPTTGEVFPQDSAYNSPEVIRALFVALRELEHTTKELDPLRNKGKPWTDIEDDKLRDEFKSKIKLSDIATEHGRTRGAIESRLDHLGLQKKSFKFWLMKKAK